MPLLLLRLHFRFDEHVLVKHQPRRSGDGDAGRPNGGEGYADSDRVVQHEVVASQGGKDEARKEGGGDDEDLQKGASSPRRGSSRKEQARPAVNSYEEGPENLLGQRVTVGGEGVPEANRVEDEGSGPCEARDDEEGGEAVEEAEEGHL